VGAGAGVWVSGLGVLPFARLDSVWYFKYFAECAGSEGLQLPVEALGVVPLAFCCSGPLA